MKYGLIGCGRISPNHIAAAKHSRLDIVGICDIDKEMVKDKCLKFDLQNANQYSDYHEMLESEKPELVAIATESGKHAAIAIDCIPCGMQCYHRKADGIIAVRCGRSHRGVSKKRGEGLCFASEPF